MVAVFPKMQSDSSIEDYTVRVARSWQVGQKNKNNGAVLFVFVQDHKMFLQVGYGLEGVLPDALCKRIIDEQITPRFKAGDFDGGLTAGVQAILAATKGEYKGTGTNGGGYQLRHLKELRHSVILRLHCVRRDYYLFSCGVRNLGPWLLVLDHWQRRKFRRMGRWWVFGRRRFPVAGFRRWRQLWRRRRGRGLVIYASKTFFQACAPRQHRAAIRDAEQKTSGQIRVSISPNHVDEPVVAAQVEFMRLGMNQSPERNGVLIFVAPRSHKFAVIGDEGVHAKCGDEFWRKLADAMTGYFRKSEFTPGIIHGVQKAGELLAEHFPRQRG